MVDGERVSVSEGGNLVIRDAAQSADGGEYVCQAINIVGARDSEPAQLQVQGKEGRTLTDFLPATKPTGLVVISCISNMVANVQFGQVCFKCEVRSDSEAFEGQIGLKRCF